MATTDKTAVYERLIKESYKKISTLEAELASQRRSQKEPVAIIGLGCRFPGGATPEAFWHSLRSGSDAIREVPAERWDVDAYYDPQPRTPGKTYARYGGFVDNVERFDADFFGISPREANALDPQQRLLLEVSWEALENTGRPPEAMPRQTGVFVGIAWGDYYQRFRSEGGELDFYAGTGSSFAAASGRLSFFYNWQGPCIALDTACSSSLVAVHLAVQSLRSGQCDAALAAGVNCILMPDSAISFAQAEALARDGRCKTFDAAADGYVRSEGCGVLVLKRLADALRDGDSVLCIIRGSAVHHDGRTSGLTVPSGPAQQVTIRHALKDAEVAPAAVRYVETHGTGTELGDPIEVNALGEVFGGERAVPLLIGAVKSNIGHTEAAAGIAGMIKVVLAMQHGELPPNLHFRTPSPHIPWARLPLVVPTAPVAWPVAEQLAGVSSFGVSGTNAHVVLGAYTAGSAAPGDFNGTVAAVSAASPTFDILPLSAKTDAALTELAGRYEDYLAGTKVRWEEVCYAASVGRTPLPQRLAIVAASPEEARDRLAARRGEKAPGAALQGPLRVAFLFTGGGAQYVDMGRTLYETQPVFRSVIDRCDAVMRAEFGESLLAVLHSPGAVGAGAQGSAPRLDQIAYTQPAMYALECALAEVWKSWGIEPAAVMGHSLGEYVAACVAGVFSLEDGFRLITARGRLMQQTRAGSMLSVRAGQARVAAAITAYAGRVDIAAVNSPDDVVISGERESVQAIAAQLAAAGIETRPLAISIAAHSPLLEPMLDPFEQLARKVQFQRPRISLVSNVTGQLLPEGQTADAGYWRLHTRAPVLYMAGLDALHDGGYRTFLEIGPRPTLSSLGADLLGARSEHEAVFLPSLVKGQDDWQVMLQTLGTLFARGAGVHWPAVHTRIGRQPPARAARGPYPLPNYPFQRKRFWFQSRAPLPTSCASGEPDKERAMMSPSPRSSARLDSLHNELREQLGKKLYLAPGQVELHMPFVDMGGDSVQLADVVRVLERQYGLKIGVRRLFDDLNTLDKLSRYLDENLRETSIVAPTVMQAVPVQPPAEQPDRKEQKTAIAPVPLPPVESSMVERVIKQQLQTMSQLMAQQLAALGQAAPPALPQTEPARPSPPVPKPSSATAPVAPTPRLQSRTKESLTPPQQRYVDRLIEELTRRTPTSKQMAQRSRRNLADSRAAAGFRPLIKEILYPICSNRSQGSTIWDVDGNQYLDFTMGFGVSLFGHQAPFIVEALRAQIDGSAFQIGPQCALAGEVAQRLCALTGMERAAFCNSGTEAVLTALRLARTATGRTKVARFAGDYNGHFDGALTIAANGNADPTAMPMCPGVPAGSVQDMLVLEFDDPSSLAVLRAHAHELAAVLTSPVQSRRPHLQAKEFLRSLRQITREAGAALISDEILMGFRVHPGPTHTWLGFDVDIATYGKLIGGGLPIGAVAGTARFMDCLDGGHWQYGDDSSPQSETTIFAGTFNKNPLTMAATRAVLTYLAEHSAPHYARLNAMTARLGRELGEFFAGQGVPLQITHLGGTFRITSSQNLDLFFYTLLNKGIYIWEGRAFFISFAHSDADIARFIQVVKETVTELRAAGFLQGAAMPQVAPAQPTAPLSAAQKQLFTLAQISAEGSLAYHVPLNLVLRGHLHLGSLRQAVQALVDRHEALRTIFAEDGQTQRVLPALHVPVPVVDLSDRDAAERADAVTRWFAAQNQRTFDLVRGPLIRASVLKLAADEHLLAVSVHHIVSDGWSMGVLADELAALYTEALQGVPARLDAPISYREQLASQQALRETGALRAQATYWLEQLGDPLPRLDLPTDRQRPSIVHYRAARRTLRLDAQLTRELRALARAQGCTLYMLLLAGYTLLLHRLSGQDELLIGSPISGRGSASPGALDRSRIVGYCTHLLPLRSRLPPSASFLDHLARIKQTVLDAFANEDHPFAWLLEHLRADKRLSARSDGSGELLNTLFSFDPPVRLPEMAGLKIEPFSQPIHYAAYDLVTQVVDVDGEIIWDVDYSTELFDDATIARWLSHLQTLLQQVVNAPRALAVTCPLLTPRERQGILVDWNATAKTYPDRRVHEWLEVQARTNPDTLAVVFADGASDGQPAHESLTYRELNARANQLAHALRRRGVGPDVIVGLYAEPSLALIVGIAGILKAGGAYLPLDPGHPPARRERIVAHARPWGILTQASLLASAPHGSPQVLCLDDASVSQESTHDASAAVQPQHLIYVLYTSGSTGEPKGVAMPHAGIANLVSAQQELFSSSRPARTLQFAPSSFDVSAQEIFSTWATGGTLYLGTQQTRRNPEALHQFLGQHAIERLFMPFVALQQLAEVDAERPPLSSLRELITAGEQLRVTSALIRFFARIPSCTLTNQYGPTETHVASSFCLTGPPERWPALPAIGRPLANTRIYLLDRNLQPVPVGVVGELYVGGAQLARGYLHQPELTRERFIDIAARDWGSGDGAPQRLYRTGDLARYLPDGNIEFLGRADQQIKIRGFRVELGEIEALLASHSAVQDAAVVVHGDGSDKRLVAYYVPASGGEPSGLRAFAKANLPDYMIPAAFIALAAFPLTASGKVDRRRLPAPAPGAGPPAATPPRTPTEIAIAKIWRELMSLDPIDTETDFFDAGGHSLLLTRVGSRIRSRFQVEFPLQSLYRATTIRAQAELVDSLGGLSPHQDAAARDTGEL